jgi:hypothetical protein
MESKFNLPTETVELPSKGLLYPQDSPLSSGTIEMKYMTAREEDILSNSNYIIKGTVIDKLLQSLIVNKDIKLHEILVGDKNALLIAARILSYGKDYKTQYGGETIDIDLSKLDHKKIDYTLFKDGKNKFEIKLPNTDNIVTIKILNSADEKAISEEIEGNKKIQKENITSVSSRLKHLITSVNGITEKKDIRHFVDNFLLAKDARIIRQFYEEINPDINLDYKFTNRNGGEEVVSIPIGIDFFWPDA